MIKVSRLKIDRFYANVAFAHDLWFLRVSTKLPSKEFKAYQLIGITFKLYEEIFVLTFHLLFFKFSLGWFRK